MIETALQKATTVANGVCEAISSAAATAIASAKSAGTPRSQVLLQTTNLLPGASADPDFGATMTDVMAKAKDQLKGIIY